MFDAFVFTFSITTFVWYCYSGFTTIEPSGKPAWKEIIDNMWEQSKKGNIPRIHLQQTEYRAATFTHPSGVYIRNTNTRAY